MAESDTAVLAQDTATTAPDTEVADAVATAITAPDTAANVVPDTDAPETPDTVDEPESAFSQEDFEKRLKEERDRWENEKRTEIENTAREEAARNRRLQNEQLRTGQTAQQLANIAKWAFEQGEAGNDFRFDPRAVQQLALQMEAGIFQDQSDGWSMAFNQYLAKNHGDFRPSRQTAERLERAFRDWMPDEAVNAQFTAMAEAVRAELTPKIRQEIEAELKQKNESAGKTQALKDADAQRRAAGRPTASGDAGGNPPDLSSVIGNPNVPLSERRKAYRAVYGMAPPF